MAESTLVMTKQANKLDGSLKQKAYTFFEKLTRDDESPGLHIEPIASCRDKRVRTGRVDQQYRAVLFKLSGEGRNHYVIEGIYNHDEAYVVATSVELAVNPINGLPEITRAEPGLAETESAVPPVSPAPEPVKAPPLITASRAELVDELGLNEDLVTRALAITNEDDLLDLAAQQSGWQGAALVDLASGQSVDEVRQALFAPVTDADIPPASEAVAEEGSDAELLQSLRRPAATMEFATIDGVDELRRVIENEDFGAWRIFLHPTQRRFVDRRWNGSFRLGGGAGTGKTVVVLHRAASLIHENAQARVVVTTFTTNLAQELQRGLQSLDPDLMVTKTLGAPGAFVGGIDSLASAVIKGAGPDIADAAAAILGTGRTDLTRRTAGSMWRDVMEQAGSSLPQHLAHQPLLVGEYEQVILPNGITAQDEYLKVRRPGRGVRLNRADRAAIWGVVEQYRLKSRLAGSIDFAEAAAIAAKHLESAAPVADHVLVDEGQDLSPVHWKLIRALVAEAPNDIFIAEDSHQRIYGPRLVLSRYGIRTKGRSSQRLTLNYRTTAQILRWATGVLAGGNYLDLDEDDESTSGYRSARRGPKVVAHRAASQVDEMQFAADTVQRWISDGAEGETVAILVRDRSQRERLATALHERGVTVRAVDRESVGPGAPVIMTMHRAKGTEFSKVLLYGLSSRSIPMGLREYEFDAQEKDEALLRERSLLYVAASRARDELVVSWTGEATPLLPENEPESK